METVGSQTYMILNKEDSSVRDSPMVYLDQVNSSFDTHQYLSKQNYSIHLSQFTFLVSLKNMKQSTQTFVNIPEKSRSHTDPFDRN